MSLLERTTLEPSDAELIARVRGGDRDAYGHLFERHRDAAARLAGSLSRSGDADDLVSEAFVKVFNVLLKGGGPDLAFRAYLLTAVRRIHVDRIRATQRTTPTDEIETLDRELPFDDPAVAGFEGEAAARAYKSLPERWQLVLWHLEVEGQKPAEIAPLLGMSPNSVSVLAYRAREGLRQAFLQQHAASVDAETCAWTRDKLGGYVRHGLSRRDTQKVDQHLHHCRPCTAVYLELTEVNSSLAAVLGPLVLGSTAAAYLAGGTAAGTGLLAAVGGLWSRGVDFVAAQSQTALVAGATATAVGVGAVGVVVAMPDDQESAARTADVREGAPVTDGAPPAPSTPLPTAVSPPTAPPVDTAPTPEPDEPVVALEPAPDTVPEPDPAPVVEAPPEESPAPSPEPTPTPTPEPTPEEPVVTRVDVGLELTLLSSHRHLLEILLPHRHTRFRITTAGVPTGETTTVLVTLDRDLLRAGHRIPANCERSSPRTLSCTVSDSSQPLTFHLRTRTTQPVRVDATIAPLPGTEDPALGNNSGSITGAG